MHFKISKNWCTKFYEKFANLIKLSISELSIYQRQNVPYIYPKNKWFLNGQKKVAMTGIFGQYQIFFSFSIKRTLWKCSCCLVLLFAFWRLFRQATVSGGFLSLSNKGKPTIKTVLNTCPNTYISLRQDLHKTCQFLAKNCARLVVSWPRLDSRLAKT